MVSARLIALPCVACLAWGKKFGPEAEARPEEVQGDCLLQRVVTRRQSLASEDAALLAARALPAPRTLLWNGSALAKLRKRTLSSNVPNWSMAPLANLKALADKRINFSAGIRKGVGAGPWSPINKTAVRSPDDDQRSFATFKTYAWPCNYTCQMALSANPKIKKSCERWTDHHGACSSETGLPYVSHDGFQNPAAGLDSESIIVMADTLELMTLAWWFTDEAKYATAAMRIFKTWFIDNSTRMNPHMKYAQLMPGQEGRIPALIPASYRWNSKLNDCVAILETDTKIWTAEIAAAWQKWSSDWLEWWSSSEAGQANSQKHGNHGTYYHVHKLAMAYSLGRGEVCTDLVGQLWKSLPCSFVSQIESSGEMPDEAKRVAGISYSLMNLEGFLSLAIMAQRVCSQYRCTSTLAWDDESTEPENGGTWAETAGLFAKCKHLGSNKMESIDACKRECLDLAAAGCNTFMSRPVKDRYACNFKDCRGEDFQVEADQRWILHEYNEPWLPGRGSVKKAFQYLVPFADGKDYWLRTHPKTDESNDSPRNWRRLGKFARMVSSSFLNGSSEYEARVTRYDDQFPASWESLVFPPPEFVLRGE